MPCKPRIEYPGACYHVICRGNRKETIFRDDINRNMFIATLGQTCDRTGWIVHSYVLMRNHYHLLLETPKANLSLGMQWFQGTYTQRYSIRHSLVGHVFQGRYKAPLIDPDDPEYFRIAGDYVHLNPARASLLRGKSPRLSCYPSFLSVPSKRPGWLEFSPVVNSLGIAKDDNTGAAAISHLHGVSGAGMSPGAPGGGMGAIPAGVVPGGRFVPGPVAGSNRRNKAREEGIVIRWTDHCGAQRKAGPRTDSEVPGNFQHLGSGIERDERKPTPASKASSGSSRRKLSLQTSG